MMGQRNYMYSKYCLYENSIRVPLILSGSIIPEEKRGMLDMRLAELVDIVPTLSKIAGHSVNPMLPGLDLLGERKGQVHLQSFMVEGMNKHSHPLRICGEKSDTNLLYTYQLLLITLHKA